MLPRLILLALLAALIATVMTCSQRVIDDTDPAPSTGLLHTPVSPQCPLNTSNPFGMPDPIYTSLGYPGHPGIDFNCPVGSPVYAADHGTVVSNKHHASAGLMVVLEHPHGRTRYLHLQSTTVSPGETVTRGQAIGTIGITGITSGPHLHFDYYPSNANPNNAYRGRVDPLPYITQ